MAIKGGLKTAVSLEMSLPNGQVKALESCLEEDEITRTPNVSDYMAGKVTMWE